jgi:hypothetical protein
MKRSCAALCALVLVLSAIACKSDGEKRLAGDPNIPEFIANPPTAEDAIFGVGSAKMNNSSQAMSAADARARTDISAKLSTQVQAMIIDYSRNAGTDNNQASLSFYESVSRQLTEATLRGVEVVKREQTADGTYWTLARMSKSEAAQQAADAIQDVYENEASRYAEFKAMDALKMMDDQLNKE